MFSSNAPVVIIDGSDLLMVNTADGLALTADAYVSDCDNTGRTSNCDRMVIS
jgi:hypothetical protein